MRILVAGGGGFLGSHLTVRLHGQGHDVVILDNFLTGRRENLPPLDGAERGRGSIQLIVGDASRCQLPGGHFDAILHLASPASPRDYHRYPVETLEAGSSATHRLLELARLSDARFLLASTSEVYGDPQIHPQPEDYWGYVNSVGPRAVYDEAKRYAEAVTSTYGRHFWVKVRIARIFNTYGPRMRLDDGRVIPTFVVQALRGEPLTIQGNGSQTRSYCYVDDLVAGLDALLWSDVEGPVNLGSDDEHTVRSIAERVLAITGSPSQIEFIPLPEDDPRLRRPCLSKALENLKWVPRVAVNEGLRRTVHDIATRLGVVKTDASSTTPQMEETLNGVILSTRGRGRHAPDADSPMTRWHSRG